MPKCDYCDVYLTHDSMSVRKAHNTGKNHLRNVVEYYQQIGHDRAQSVIDSITNSYAAEGQAGANPMLAPQGGLGGPSFPPNMNFPGGMPPFMPGGPPPPVGFPPPNMPGGMPFPFPPNAGGPGGGPPPAMPGGMPGFPPPGGMPPDFRFPPPGFPPPQNMGGGPPGPGGPPGGPPGSFGPPPGFGGNDDRR